jgi:hypothetical protein
VGSDALPCDCCASTRTTENFLHHGFNGSRNVRPHVHINAPLFRQQVPHQHQPFVNHADEGIRPPPPGVPVGDLLQQVGFLVEGLAADLDVHAEVGADVEGRVDVDELEAAGLLDLAAQGAGFQGRQDELVVAPDELVGPALELAPPGVQPVLLDTQRTFVARLVDVLQGLEGQHGGADVAALAVPHQFHLAFVLEQDEAVFLRQGLALLDQRDEVALLGFAQVVGGGAGHGF